jgi:hypothetical protein
MIGAHYAGDNEYAGTRIDSTIVMYAGRPVVVSRVDRVGNKPVAHVRQLQDNMELTVDLDDLDICPPEIGYVNMHGIASYICRMPKRRDYKQGTRMQNLFSHYGLNIRDITQANLYNTFMGVFPSYKDCINTVQMNPESPVISMAWGNDWAIDCEANLRHRFGKSVGRVEDSQPILFKEYQYLQDALQRSLN